MKAFLLAFPIMVSLATHSLAQNPPEKNPKDWPTPKALTALEQQFNSDAAKILTVGQEMTKVETVLQAKKEAKQPHSAESTRSKQLQADWKRLEKSLYELQAKIELDRKAARVKGQPCSEVKMYPKLLNVWQWRYVVKL